MNKPGLFANDIIVGPGMAIQCNTNLEDMLTKIIKMQKQIMLNVISIGIYNPIFAVGAKALIVFKPCIRSYIYLLNF